MGLSDVGVCKLRAKQLPIVHPSSRLLYTIAREGFDTGILMHMAEIIISSYALPLLAIALLTVLYLYSTNYLSSPMLAAISSNQVIRPPAEPSGDGNAREGDDLLQVPLDLQPGDVRVSRLFIHPIKVSGKLSHTSSRLTVTCKTHPS
jgi:hypothetical protein